MAEDDKNKNPAEDVLGAIPAGGTAQTGYTGVPSTYVPPTGRGPKPIFDGKGNLVTYGYYDINTDKNVILQQMKPTLRTQVLNGLALRVSGYKPGNGLEDKDKAVFGDLLVYANVAGKPWSEAYADYVKQVPVVQKVSKAPLIRVTSADDVKAVFRKTAQDLLGRDVGDAAAATFADMYRKLQIGTAQKMQKGGVVVQEPDASVLAEKKIEKQFGAQTQAYRAMQFMEIMDGAIKKLGS